MDRIVLYDALCTRLSESDLKAITFRLQMRYESLPGDAITDKLMHLIQSLEDRQQLETLLPVLHKVRSDLHALLAQEKVGRVRQQTQYETWELDMDDLMRTLPRLLDAPLVGLGLAFDEVNFETGSDLVLQHVCRRVRNDYGWQTSESPVRTWHYTLPQMTQNEIRRAVKKLRDSHFFYNVKVKFSTEAEANAFWDTLRQAFDVELQRLFGTEKTCSMVVVMAGGPQTIFPQAVRRLEFTIHQEHVYDWVFRVVNDMTQRLGVRAWPPTIARDWTDLAWRNSQTTQDISLYDLITLLSQSTQLLTECHTGHDFVQILRQW
jgi:hypothetical protein